MRPLTNILNAMGYSLTEFMFSMTILAIGLLSIAQMRIIALQGFVSSRQLSNATKLAYETISEVKMPGVFFEDSKSGFITKLSPILVNTTSANDADGDFYWAVTKETSIDDLSLAAGSRPFIFDFIEVLTASDKTFPRACGKPLTSTGPTAWPDTRTAYELDGADYVRIVNTRNIPANAVHDDAIMKEVNVIVLWKERGRTRSVNINTLVGRKNSAFF